MNSPFEHRPDIDNYFQSSIENEAVIETLLLSEIQPQFKEFENKFIIESESLKNFFENEILIN